MPQTGQSPVLAAGAGLVAVVGGLEGVVVVEVVVVGKVNVEMAGVEVLPLKEDVVNVNGGTAVGAAEELFDAPVKLNVGAVDVGAAFLSAAVGAFFSCALKEGSNGGVLIELFVLPVCCSFSSPAAVFLPSSLAFSVGLLLLPVALLLLVEVAGVVIEGNVNGVLPKEVDNDADVNPTPLSEPNLIGTPDPADPADDPAPAAKALPKPTADGSEGALEAADEDGVRAELEVLNANGVVAGAGASLSVRVSVSCSVGVGLAKGLGLCLLSSSSSTVRRLRLNDEDDKVDTSMPVAEDAKGAMKGVETDDEDEDEEEEDEDRDDDVDEEPLRADDVAGEEKAGTAGSSALLLLCDARSLAISFSLSLSFSLTFLSSTLFVVFLSSLSSATSSFSSRSLSLSLTTTAGNCRLFTAIIAPPPVPPTPLNPNFRVGSNRPRKLDLPTPATPPPAD